MPTGYFPYSQIARIWSGYIAGMERTYGRMGCFRRVDFQPASSRRQFSGHSLRIKRHRCYGVSRVLESDRLELERPNVLYRSGFQRDSPGSVTLRT
jgi:hypothetical protein